MASYPSLSLDFNTWLALKVRIFRGGDGNLFAGLRVPSSAGCLPFHDKIPEPTYLHMSFFGDGFLERFQGKLHQVKGFFLSA